MAKRFEIETAYYKLKGGNVSMRSGIHIPPNFYKGTSGEYDRYKPAPRITKEEYEKAKLMEALE